MKHFNNALKEIKPSLTENLKKYYKEVDLKKNMEERDISYVG